MINTSNTDPARLLERYKELTLNGTVDWHLIEPTHAGQDLLQQLKTAETELLEKWNRAIFDHHPDQNVLQKPLESARKLTEIRCKMEGVPHKLGESVPAAEQAARLVEVGRSEEALRLLAVSSATAQDFTKARAKLRRPLAWLLPLLISILIASIGTFTGTAFMLWRIESLITPIPTATPTPIPTATPTPIPTATPTPIPTATPTPIPTAIPEPGRLSDPQLQFTTEERSRLPENGEIRFKFRNINTMESNIITTTINLNAQKPLSSLSEEDLKGVVQLIQNPGDLLQLTVLGMTSEEPLVERSFVAPELEVTDLPGSLNDVPDIVRNSNLLECAASSPCFIKLFTDPEFQIPVEGNAVIGNGDRLLILWARNTTAGFRVYRVRVRSINADLASSRPGTTPAEGVEGWVWLP